jgi:ABC-type transport system involved in multi-copper enzyme maturation permease subunit
MLRDRLLGNVFTKTIRDWLLWTIIATVALWAAAALYVWIMTIAGDEYMTLMDDMPEAFTNIYGQHDGTPAGLAMSGVFSVMGPLILLAYAIGLGSSAAVGEEEARTLPILLSNPLRRRTVLLTKTTVATIGLVIIMALTWLGVEATGLIFGMDLSDQAVLATSIQLLGMVLFFGALALGVSAWRGSSALGIGVAAGLAVVSYFVTTLLPVVEDLAEVARLTPWYLFSGADSLSQGLDPILLAIAVILAIALVGGATYTFERRDLKG